MKQLALIVAAICVGLSGCQLVGPDAGSVTVRTDRQAYHADSRAVLSIANESRSNLYLWQNCSQIDGFFGPPPTDRARQPVHRRICSEDTGWPPPQILPPGETLEKTFNAGWDVGPKLETVRYRVQQFVTLDREGRYPIPSDVTISNTFTVWNTPAVWVARAFSGGRQCGPRLSFHPPDTARLLEGTGAVVLDVAIVPLGVCAACSCPSYAAVHMALVRERDLAVAVAAGFHPSDGPT